MLRNLAYTLSFIGLLGAVVYTATTHVVEVRERMSGMQQDVAQLRSDLADLQQRIDEPRPTPPSPPTPVRPGQPDPNVVYAVPVADAPSRGPVDAAVTIVEFTDYQCPFCSRVEGTLDELRERYPDDVRVVVQHLPLGFHRHAFDAAVAAECAGEQDKFWEAHELLFARARELSETNTPASLVRDLQGIHAGRFDACVASEKARTRVAEDARLAERFGVRGTPSFFVNGKFLSGAQPIQKFVEVVERERALAHASDIPASEYYRRAVLEKGALGL
jgi:protein-disulfide isomerase